MYRIPPEQLGDSQALNSNSSLQTPPFVFDVKLGGPPVSRYAVRTCHALFVYSDINLPPAIVHNAAAM